MTSRLLCLLLILCSGLNAQNLRNEDNLHQFTNSDKLERLLEQERIYLHFDNTCYYLGERMWFKAYVIQNDWIKQQDKAESKTLYVELVNPFGEVVLSRILAIKKGQAHGDIPIHPLLQEGFYQVRAYTLSSNRMFSRTFPILAPTNENNENMHENTTIWENRTTEKKQFDVQFFPEGGHLLTDGNQRVAYCITPNKNAILPHYAELKDSRGNCLKRIEVNSDGRGLFSFFVSQNETYVLCLDGQTFKLPQAAQSGATICIDQTEDKFRVSIRTSGPQDDMALVAVNMGNVEWFHHLTDTTRSIIIERSDLNPGVSRFLLINKEGHVKACRAVFVHPETAKNGRDFIQHVSVELVGKETIQPHGWQQVLLRGAANQTLSLSIADADRQIKGSCLNAASWLLLQGEVHGYVENVESYLETDDHESRMRADLLMLTQAWENIDVYNLATKRPHKKQTGIPVSGIVRYKARNNKVGSPLNTRSGILSIYNLGESTPTDIPFSIDETGHFYIEIPQKCQGQAMTFALGKGKPDWKETEKVVFEIIKDRPKYIIDNLKEIAQLEKNMGHPIKRLSQKERTCFFFDMTALTQQHLDVNKRAPELYKWVLQTKPMTEAIMSGRPVCWGTGSVSFEPARKITHRSNGKPYTVVHRMKPAAHHVNFKQSNYLTQPYSDFYDPIDRTGLWYQAPYIPATEWESSPTQKAKIEGAPYVYTAATTAVYVNMAPVCNPLSKKEYGSTQPILIDIEGLFPSTPDGDLSAKGKLQVFPFMGYHTPATYVTPTLKQLPAAKDTRRTLYWSPAITLDKEGKAMVEFRNNNARNIIINIEGFSSKLRPVITNVIAQ